MLDIPKDKNYPSDAVQCGGCGGLGCKTCNQKGWLEAGHPEARKCEREECGNVLAPDHVAVYCSDQCARMDA